MNGRFAAAWCAQALLRELVLIYPTAALLMQDRGVSPVALASLFMIWSGGALVFEVPSGVLADRMSRRNLLVASGLVKGSAFLVWLGAPSYWGFATGFLIWSLGSALRSGTAEAFLHDVLASQGRVAEFERLYGWQQAASNVGVALALVLGGWLAEGGYTLPLVLSTLAPWGASLVVFLALEDPPRRVHVAQERFTDTLRAGVAEVGRTGRIRLVLAMIVLLVTVYDVFEEFLPPLLNEGDFSFTGVGLVLGLAFLVRSVAAGVAWRLRSLPDWLLGAGFAAGGSLLVLGALSGPVILVAALCGFFALSSTGGVLLQGRLQQAISGHARATVTSLSGTLQELMSLALYLGIGAVAQSGDWHRATAATGLGLLLVAGCFVWLLTRRNRPRTGSR